MTQNATDFENQVVNLVKAAMSGDEEANDVIVQIIEAAKKGDEQALKVVALIKQLTQSTSDQAEEGAEENTEVMKCGGKVRAKMKAKKSAEKKEEGGEIPEEKCGGTAKKMRKAVCKAKKCKEGDKLTDTQKFLLGAKCGCKVKKTKKCENGDTLDNWEDPLSVKCGGKAKKVKKGENGVQLPKGAHGRVWSKSTSAVFAKGGNTCPCALKRVGGKIVTVDSCTGLPIHKNGGNVNYLQTGGVYHIGGSIKKFQSPDSPIKKNKFFQYLSEMGPMLRGARLNSPAVTNVEETVKTNPVKAKYDAALYGYSDLMGAVSGVGGALAYHPIMIAQIPQLSTVSGVTIGAAPAIGMSSVAFSETPLNSSSEQHQTTTNQEQPTTVSAPAVVSEQPVSTAVQEQPADPAASVVNQEQSAAPATPAVTQETFMSWLKKNAPSYQSYNSRKQLAEQYGIANYKGTTAQNILLWNKMKQAKYGWDNPHNVYKTISENRVENDFTNPEEKQFALNALLNPQEILPKQQVLSIQPANIKIPEIKLYTTNN